jgi:hypothetical protein
MAMAKAAFNKKAVFTSNLELNLKKNLVRNCIRSMVLKLEHFGKWIRNTLKVSKCGARRRIEISWTDRVRNEVLQRVKEEGIS